MYFIQTCVCVYVSESLEGGHYCKFVNMTNVDIYECISDYYQTWPFLVDEDLRVFHTLYSSFVTAIYIHDLWGCFGFATLTIIFPQLLLMVWMAIGNTGMQLMYPDPAKAMFLLACATMGIAIGSWVSMLSKSPRIFIDPYREKKMMEDDYGKGILNESSPVFMFTRNEYNLLKAKYWLQFIVITAMSYLMIFVWSSQVQVSSGAWYEHFVEDTLVLKKFTYFRVDWVGYVTFNLATIILFYYWNYSSKIEELIIWRRNKENYDTLFRLWLLVFFLIFAPSAVMWSTPMVLVVVGAGLCFFFLLMYQFSFLIEAFQESDMIRKLLYKSERGDINKIK
jgi:hypothetical protein